MSAEMVVVCEHDFHFGDCRFYRLYFPVTENHVVDFIRPGFFVVFAGAALAGPAEIGNHRALSEDFKNYSGLTFCLHFHRLFVQHPGKISVEADYYQLEKLFYDGGTVVLLSALPYKG